MLRCDVEGNGGLIVSDAKGGRKEEILLTNKLMSELIWCFMLQIHEETVQISQRLIKAAVTKVN